MSMWLEPFKTKLFGIYWLRWMASAIVMMPFMLLFEYLGLGLVANLILGQTIGSVIFFKIDKLIFKDKEKTCFEEEAKIIKDAIKDSHETPAPYKMEPVENDYEYRVG